MSESCDAAYMFPTSLKEVEKLGWDMIDIILFSGDAFIDHPSFGTAVIARVLQKEGYRVAVVPQPNWRDDLRDFRKLGPPRLFFGVNAGAMDSMVNHYTAARRLRSDDAYTPEGRAGMRPDYAVSVYTKILKSLYTDIPVIIGGIEASLRRLAHYDYWKDRLLPSVLVESGADYLVYGMGERSMVAAAHAIERGEPLWEIPQIGYFSQGTTLEEISRRGDCLLYPFEEALRDKRKFADNFEQFESQANRLHPARIIEPYSSGQVVINPTFLPATTEELDGWYALPYTKLPHPRYKGKKIPAFDMIKNSITIHRGCFGGCSFCTIAAHQGKFIQSRSADSVLAEVRKHTHHPEFKGVFSDVGAPTANMYMLGGKERKLCETCSRKSCLFPARCKNLNHSHKELLELYRSIDAVKGVKHSFVGSGIRYDLFMDENGFLDETSYIFFREVVTKHTSGWFKVAPEHTEPEVLKQMSKPSFELFAVLCREFDALMRSQGLNYKIVPYFISSHPGCTLRDMNALASHPSLRGIRLEEVQDFTPTPMTRSSAIYYTEMDIKSKKSIFVEKDPDRKREQKSVFFRKSPKSKINFVHLEKRTNIAASENKIEHGK